MEQNIFSLPLTQEKSFNLYMYIRLCNYNVHFVVKFYPWFNFDFPLFDIDHYHIIISTEKNNIENQN